jgi:hypothetical protein
VDTASEITNACFHRMGRSHAQTPTRLRPVLTHGAGWRLERRTALVLRHQDSSRVHGTAEASPPP